MCGKYHVSMEDDNILFRGFIEAHNALRGGLEVYPSVRAPVITAAALRPMVFGIPLSRLSRPVINARCETAANSPLFAPLLKANRCLVPSSRFYEWTKDKTAFAFFQKDKKIMMMAGLYIDQSQGSRFVIITRPANPQVAAVHPRMPLLLPSKEYQSAWLHSPCLSKELLLLHQEADLLATAVSA